MNDVSAPRAIAVDPITVEVIGSALSSIAEEMGEALIRASYSTNIKERRDCSTALFDLGGNTLCQAEHIPMHLGSFLGLIPHIMKRHELSEMQPGDVFCGNDAYEGGGTHLPDIVLAEPIFVDGKITAWAVNLAHHADFADRGHAHIYQEGLRIPPVRLYRAGVLQTIVDPTILPNAGLARPLHVTAPEGTVVNCVHPAAVNGRLSLCQRIVDLIFGALAPAVPDRVIAAANGACFSITFSGHQPRDNALWVYLETIGGGSGARAAKDGLDGVHVHMTNTSNLPVEALELEYPLTLLRYELVDGSGGHGQFRGGMGLRRVYRAEAPCRVRVDGSRFLSSPWSLAGGEPGGRASVTLHGGAVPFDHGNGGLRKGESIEVVIAGGGGYGPAAKRDPAAVARDAAEGRV